MVDVLIITLLSLLGLCVCALPVFVCFEKGYHPLRDLCGFVWGRSWFGRAFLILFLALMSLFAERKPSDGGGDDDGGGSTNTMQMARSGEVVNLARSRADAEGESVGERQLEDDDFERGFVMTRIGTNEVFSFAAPEGATVCADWRAFGSATDWFYLGLGDWFFPLGTNEVRRLRIHSDGFVGAMGMMEYVASRVPDAADRITPRFMPFRATLGIVPAANWHLISTSQPYNCTTSQFWHVISPSNTLILTWQNALLNRESGTPVSFQAELWPSGRFVYRYDLSRAGVEEVTNVVIGASLGGTRSVASAHAWLTNALPTNVTSISFHPVTSADAINPDRDGDGISLADELFVHHTDPDLVDTDGDGIPDGAELLAGTDPLARDVSDADILGRVAASATNEAFQAADVASAGGLVSWKLFDGFAADLPAAAATNRLWTRTFTVNRSNAWQQFFVSASPTGAAAWHLDGAALEWETDEGDSGSVQASPCADSYRIPLAPEARPQTVTLRVRALGGGTVRSPHPLHLIAYAPAFRVTGGSRITGRSGRTFWVFTDGADSRIGLDIDHSLRPCRAAPGAAECDLQWFNDLCMMNTDFAFEGDSNGGIVAARRPGMFTLPDYSLGAGADASARAPRRGARLPGGNGDVAEGDTVVVLDPSASWSCRRDAGCAPDCIAYDWGTDNYYGKDVFPLDSPCLRRKWLRGYDGGITYLCELEATSGLGDFAGGGGNDLVTTSTDGDTGSVAVDGVVVWSGKGEHVHLDDGMGCGGGYREDFLGGGCDSCETDCANGNCDSLEGTTPDAPRFRIPLGSPAKGSTAGFAWFACDGPTSVSSDRLQVLAHPGASVTDAVQNGVRRITCADPRGRDLRVEDILNGVRITIYDTAAQTLEHTWEMVNEDGDISRIRLRKISRLDNVMSDETYVYGYVHLHTFDCGYWTRFDNIAGTRTETLVDEGPFDDPLVVKRETRTATDAAGITLESVVVEQSRVGDCDNAVLRETYREESTGWNWKWTCADYWNDPAHSGRHGAPRLVWGSARAWTYTDFDDLGHETLRIEQRGNAPIPSDFPYVVSNGLYEVEGLSNAFVTVRSYEPFEGDSRHPDDAPRVRVETRYVVENGAARVIGRTWRRYTRHLRGGLGVVKEETWRSAVSDAVRGDPRNSHSYRMFYDGNGEGTPLLMRNAEIESLDGNGVLTRSDHVLDSGRLRTTIRRSSGSNQYPTYEVVETDAQYGTVLRRTTRLTASDAIIADEQSVYDSQNRLRSTTYLDGTSMTNAYSCCRLLWKRDRDRRRVLRSATTGTDHLYHAEEDVWLADVSTNGAYRITRHFFDALGRETNTVVGVGFTPGCACSATSTLHSALCTLHTVYPYGGSDYSVTTDERGKVTIRSVCELDDCTETCETTLTNGVEVMRTKSRAYHGGGISTHCEWTVCDASGGTRSCSSEERRFDDYAADGRRIAYVVTESSDCGVVTNSVTTYDLIGREVSRIVPGANGARIETRMFYDGAASRIVRIETDGEPDIVYGYDELGERISTAQDGITNQTITAYEIVSGIVWRVTTATRLTATSMNTVRVTKERLTGLSDDCRSEVVTIDASGRETVVRKVFDPLTEILAETARKGTNTPTVVRSRFGLALEETSLDECVVRSYDAFGRCVESTAAHARTGAPIRSEIYSYDSTGNVTTNAVAYAGTGTTVATSVFDALNRETSRTDALGHSLQTTLDPLGRVVAVDGDQYPLRTDYDTAGRKTNGFTTRDGGASWDETRWEFDPASGVNMAKEYADGSRIVYAYTDNGRKTRMTWARGAWRENSYNAGGLVGGVTYSDATPSVSYMYDQSRQLASATLSNGTSCAYSYDDRLLCTNEVVTGIGNGAVAVARTYDAFRRPSSTFVVVTNVVHTSKMRQYDDEDRVTGYALTNAAGRGVAVALAYDGSYLTNSVYTLPNGSRFSANLQRNPGRRNLVTRRDYAFNGNSVYWYSTGFDLLGRPTNAVDSVSLVRAYLYNRRSELAAALIGTNAFSYAYDTIGNRTSDTFNGMARSYAANNLNQYSSISTLCASASPRETNPSYDVDGNLVQDGHFAYSYDAENRLIFVAPRIPVEGSFSVENRYNHKNLRVRKIVRRYTDGGWTDYATHDFTYDGGNIVLERITFTDGATRTCEYFWGNDLSGTEQGAGGVGGLVAVSVDGAFFIPCYDHNGNIVCYVSESGTIAAQYVYDPYGNVIEQYGTNPHRFNFGFSTKYHDLEAGMIGYQSRFYCLDSGRWLNRDPLEENGCENVYEFVRNCPTVLLDAFGFEVWIIKHLPGDDLMAEWVSPDVAAQTNFKASKPTWTTIGPDRYGKIRFKVTLTPPVSHLDIYFRAGLSHIEYYKAYNAEMQHVKSYVQYDKSIEKFKQDAERIYDCQNLANAEILRLYRDLEKIAKETLHFNNDVLDGKGGPHGH